jgi:hypothetical protein
MMSFELCSDLRVRLFMPMRLAANSPTNGYYSGHFGWRRGRRSLFVQLATVVNYKNLGANRARDAVGSCLGSHSKASASGS